MPTSMTTSGTVSARTWFLHAGTETYAYRRFGGGPARPLLFLQHFMGTLDNWDPSVADPLASGREVILFDNAGRRPLDRTVPGTVDAMAAHVLAFLDGIGMATCDVLGFSLGGMVAQQIALKRPSTSSDDPDSGHGSLFQFHESFTRQAAAFLASDSPSAPY